MSTFRFIDFTSAAVAVVGCLLITPAGFAGDLTPPAGPVIETMKTLDEVEPSTPVGPLTTPGDAGAAYVIAESGAYHLTGDILGQSGIHAGIRIDASDVLLDLRGFAIRGNISGANVGILAGDNITIRNGTIAGWANYGIHFVFDGNRIADVTFVNNGNGVILNGLTLATDCLIVGGGRGFVATGSDNVFTRCRVSGTSGDGFAMANRSGLTFRECVSIDNAGAGFNAGDHATLVDCRAERNGGDGFRMGESPSVRGSRANDNTGDGFMVGINASVADALATGNAGAGIHTGGGSSIRDSVLSQNDSGIVLDTAIPGSGEGSIVDRCVLRANTNYGLRAEDIGAEQVSQLIISSSVIEGNGQNGVLVEYQARIVDNKISLNGSLGGPDSGGLLIRSQGCRVDSNEFTQNTGTAVRLRGTRNIVVRNNFAFNGGNVENAFGGNNKIGLISDVIANLGPWDNIAH